jgi:hypothetical protein
MFSERKRSDADPGDPEDEPKPKRKRRTKKEIEAARAAAGGGGAGAGSVAGTAEFGGQEDGSGDDDAAADTGAGAGAGAGSGSAEKKQRKPREYLPKHRSGWSVSCGTLSSLLLLSGGYAILMALGLNLASAVRERDYLLKVWLRSAAADPSLTWWFVAQEELIESASAHANESFRTCDFCSRCLHTSLTG